MTLDYFYGAQADQFAFYRIPKALFTDERFKSISAEAKILYGILLDRMSLSRKNGWLDEQGRVFIIFTLEEVMEAIGCADQKATKLLNELDSKAGLIERKRQGLGKPNLIFVKNFVDNSAGSIPPAPESRIKTRENHDSADVNFTTPESRKSRGSNTDSNYTDLSETETYPFPSGQVGGHGQVPVDKMGRDMDEREQYRAMVEEMWDKGDVVLDADHFVGAEFSCNDGQEIEADKPIEVLLVEPGQYARMTTIGSSLEDMQKVVGGYIQEAPFFRDPVTLVCNEEGKISGLPLNRAIRDDDGKIIDVVAGTFFICGAEGDHFSSIPKELQKKYEEKFKKPEAFLKMGRSIMAIPTEPTASNPKPDRKAPGMEL